jgi:hypothetical protein
MSNVLGNINVIPYDFDGLLDQTVLADALKTIRVDAASLFNFMNHPDHKSCDCSGCSTHLPPKRQDDGLPGKTFLSFGF